MTVLVGHVDEGDLDLLHTLDLLRRLRHRPFQGGGRLIAGNRRGQPHPNSPPPAYLDRPHHVEVTERTAQIWLLDGGDGDLQCCFVDHSKSYPHSV